MNEDFKSGVIEGLKLARKTLEITIKETEKELAKH